MIRMSRSAIILSWLSLSINMAFEFRISATKSCIASASSGHEFWFPSCKTGRNRRPEPLILLFDLICCSSSPGRDCNRSS